MLIAKFELIKSEYILVFQTLINTLDLLAA